ncbi:hypothetical protein ASE73_10665 [Sphingomonas sp. Leaf24]|uniref:hypothetical protein n=1 Tax=unclassified Sphingomonas TaxID=196159 RepID=UPI00070156C7|nr:MULTISPECIES: hypothetical protein [unclassified Sphingomonas]KQM14606.1 hypothetical protein ASE50_08715 [Sphingomonas sp. Leaf5]KQM87905.1 hypothetical protein ASE73_10665 [Sphingomonas sp. Leaf24]
MSSPSRYSRWMHWAIAIPIVVAPMAVMAVMAGFAARVACPADRPPMRRRVRVATAPFCERGDHR